MNQQSTIVGAERYLTLLQTTQHCSQPILMLPSVCPEEDHVIDVDVHTGQVLQHRISHLLDTIGRLLAPEGQCL